MSSEVLFIVEGVATEPTLVNKIINTLRIGEEIKYFCYGTTIHELYKELEDDLDDALDICLVLREKETDTGKRKILSKQYGAIYLIFDFDPHYREADIENLVAMKKLFNDPLNKGLLLINYPMIEAFKHLNKMPDYNFNNLTVSIEEIKDYKKLIHHCSYYHDYTCYSRHQIINIIFHHGVKLNYLVNAKIAFPNYDEFERIVKDENFCRKQYENYQNDSLQVVATFFYFLFDLKAKPFYEEINCLSFEDMK